MARGRNILVTGASTGIGRATAVAFARRKNKVYLTARNIDALKTTAKMVTQAGGEAVVIPADLNKFGDIKSLAEKIDKIDVIANIAAIWHTSDKVLAGVDYQNFSQEEIISTMNVGITGPMLLIRHLLPKMTSGSKIVNLSGTFKNGAKGWLPYYVSKKALEEFTIGLSQELIDRHIQVNCVSPSDTLTPSYQKFFPQYATLDQCITPEEVAQKVLDLCDPDATITGQIIVIKNNI